eukprot:CAMPEP_0117466162 /NCGR_PEP_ID=MMETSP0784-20121206/5000_1 /TAXON_ID=39447 /ORGANISM="" /LENGTH=812 /DNA_ID=CAMNT_0005260095 /DNA_START=71 /DNA_END=2509 /DNA_ORIENTATION=+
MGCGASAAKKYEAPVVVSPETEEPADDVAETRVVRPSEKRAANKENATYQKTIQFLMRVPLLRGLPLDQHPLLAAACTSVEFATDEVVIRQGDEGSAFYLIDDGEAFVLMAPGDDAEPKRVATLKAGDYFGEHALLSNEPRKATIVASSPLRTLMLTRAQFYDLGLNEKLAFANRKAVAGGRTREIETKPADPKSDAERELLKEALYKNENLQTMTDLTDDCVRALIDIAWREDVAEGTELIKQGDIVADYFYLVQSGLFEVAIEPDGHDEGNDCQDEVTTQPSRRVRCVGPGGSFGELALLHLIPRGATVEAIEESVVWVIDRNSFKRILMQSSAQLTQQRVSFMNTVSILDPLFQHEKEKLADALVEMHFVAGEVILKQGDPATSFYILQEGELVVLVDGAESSRINATAESAKVFGERALLTNEPNAETITVASDTATALVLDRDSFNFLLGSLKDLLEAENTRKDRSRASVQDAVLSAHEPQESSTSVKIGVSDLRRVGLLGTGAFGVVELWEHPATGDAYALKRMSKGSIVEMGLQENVLNEKQVLMMTNSAFIIKLYRTYNEPESLDFLMELALGGDLFTTYMVRDFYGSKVHARFYTAGVVFAFEHCHQRRIIYRDLKPENLMLTSQGHIKVTDMGLAKFVIGKTYTTCGTPDYFAPELVTSSGHTNAVDWWTLGVLIFELLTGTTPFAAKQPMKIYKKVVKGIGAVKFPSEVPNSAEQLIKGLMHQAPSQRLPMRAGGIKNIQEAEWYSGFDWDAMRQHELEPPYVPLVMGKTDLYNFCPREENIPSMLPYTDDGSGWDSDFAM